MPSSEIKNIFPDGKCRIKNKGGFFYINISYILKILIFTMKGIISENFNVEDFWNKLFVLIIQKISTYDSNLRNS